MFTKCQNENILRYFLLKKGLAPSITQIKRCLLKENAFYSGFGITFHILLSICFTWHYYSYRPDMNMCSAGPEHKGWTTSLAELQEAFSWMIILVSGLETQRNDKALLFSTASHTCGLITVILRGTKEKKLISITWQAKERPHSFIQRSVFQTEAIRETAIQKLFLLLQNLSSYFLYLF